MPYKNPEDRKANLKAYYLRTREKRLASERARYAQKRDEIKAKCAEYRAANQHKVYEWNGTRRAMLRNACPKWADREVIKILYSYAKILTIQTGIKYHVDHMIPLSGKNVCGLHIPANLQVIEATNNLRKSNRLDHA